MLNYNLDNYLCAITCKLLKNDIINDSIYIISSVYF